MGLRRKRLKGGVRRSFVPGGCRLFFRAMLLRSQAVWPDGIAPGEPVRVYLSGVFAGIGEGREDGSVRFRAMLLENKVIRPDVAPTHIDLFHAKRALRRWRGTSKEAAARRPAGGAVGLGDCR